MPSMVWPGVWRKSKRALPNWRVSPSWRAMWGKVACAVFAEVDAGSGALGKLVMAGDEVGVEVGFDDVLDAEILLAGEVEVEVDVALGVDDGGDTFAGDDVGGVGQAAEEELLNEDRFHRFHLGAVYWKGVVSCHLLRLGFAGAGFCAGRSRAKC